MFVQVIIANRNVQRAEELAAAVGPEARAVGLAELSARRPCLRGCSRRDTCYHCGKQTFCLKGSGQSMYFLGSARNYAARIRHAAK